MPYSVTLIHFALHTEKVLFFKMELIFFFCKKYLAPQINTDHDLFTLPSSPKRHPVQDAK